MIDINGWVRITTSSDGEDNIDIKGVIEQINELIYPLCGGSQFFKIENLNGFYTLFLGIHHNHENGDIDMVYNLLSSIKDVAIGSYGLVYCRLPEHESDYNKFTIIKLAKGNLTIEDDSLLSPCIPTIED